MGKYWWKILCVLLLLYIIIGGILLPVPAIPKLNESARNLFYHVPIWFALIFMMFFSLVYSLFALRHNKIEFDLKAKDLIRKLLNPEINYRLGVHDVKNIFNNISKLFNLKFRVERAL